MRKPGKFFIGIVPFLIALLLQVVAMILLEIIYVVRESGAELGLQGIMNVISSSTQDTAFMQYTNLVYAALALLVFGIWYGLIFVRPFAKKRRESNHPTGFSIHTIAALFFMAIGLQMLVGYVVDLVAGVMSSWMNTYSNLMDMAGYNDLSPALILYTLILAPIIEELIFRGLIFRYARYAGPFWAANLWQALLFGVMHMNLIQGIYAFLLGLFLGWVVHRGRGIKYSMVLHMIFNCLGLFFADLIRFATVAGRQWAILACAVLLIFAIWLFYTDFIPARIRKPVHREEYYDDEDWEGED